MDSQTSRTNVSLKYRLSEFQIEISRRQITGLIISKILKSWSCRYRVRFINKFPYSIKSKPSKLYVHEIWHTEGSNLLGIRNEILWHYVEGIQNSIYFSEVRWSKMADIIESSPAHQNFSRYDIRVIIKFSVILGKDASCIHKDLVTVLRENAPSIQTVRKWVKAVLEGRDDMEDEPRPGRPVTACRDANISKVLVSLSDDRRKTCEEISTETSMSRTSVFRVLTNKLNKKKKFSKWVPQLLTDEQKESRVNFSRNLLLRFQTEQNDFLGRIITGDETWVYSWDAETKRQSAEWRDFDEPRPEKVQRKQGALKVMHMIFFDMNGVILRWPVPIGTTINAQYYKKVLQDILRPAIRKERPGLLESGILFHHDNAPVHTARAVTDVLAGYKWELLEHPRYSPDLAPCDFHLFPKMKEHLRGQRFETVEDIIQATKVAIKNLDKCSYVTAFKDWLQRIEKCANNGGYYVE